MTTVTIHVPGVPATKGSTRSFVNPKTGKVVTVSANKRLNAFEAKVATFAAQKWRRKPSTDRVRIQLHFWFARQKSHTRKDGSLRDSAPLHMTRRPDLDKLVRAVLDGLTGVVFVDDSQVTEINAVKYYGDPSTVITVDA